MTATVAITTGHRDDVLRVAIRALSFSPPEPGGHGPARTPGAHHGDHAGVWRLAPDGALQRVDVQTGLRDEQYAEVEGDTLAVGDEVAVGLRHGPAKKEAVHIPGQMHFH